MKILITGTHFTPAQAVIEEFKKDPKIKITYLGRRYTREGDKTPSPESQILPKLGVKFIPIITGRLQRSFTIYTIPSLLKIPFGLIQSFYLVFKENPDVVLSFGGYVAVPVVISAWLLNIPIIVHEQTLVQGLANKISSLFADKIATSFPNIYQKSSKVVLTGNPLRKELLDGSSRPKPGMTSEVEKIIDRAEREHLPVILITGGNQGSHVINQTVFKILDQLIKIALVVHQTGDSKYLDYEASLKKRDSLQKPENYLVKRWFDVNEMKKLFQKSDLVVSRAGINTLVELAYFSTPVILIPIYPHFEQEVNAKYFSDLGLAKVLPQNKLTGETLLLEIKTSLENINNLKLAAQNASKIVIKDAAKRLSLETILISKKD